MNEVIAKYDRMTDQSGEAHARLIAPELINEIKRLENRVAELEGDLKWWAGLVDKYHENGVRSNMTEIVQSFIDRADAAEKRVAELEELLFQCQHCELKNEALAPKDGE